MEYKFNEKNFEEEVLKSSVPVLVDFYATWCGPCKMMSPKVTAIAEKFEGRAKVGKVNADESIGLATKYGIMSIPAFLFFKNGQVVQTVIGAVPQENLEAELEKLM